MTGTSAGRQRLRGTLVLAAATAVLGGVLPPAGAAPITPQPEQAWETGVVTKVDDGDTITVAIASGADLGFVAPPESTDPAVPSARTYCAERLGPGGAMPADGDLDGCRVRLIGIQAPEKAGASGGSALEQCLASAATQALKAALPLGTTVQLRSISVRSREDDYSGGRLARTVYRQDATGQWVDVGRAVMASGTAMWFPFHVGDAEKPEYVHNLAYRQLADEAAAAGRGLWSANLCGSSTPAAVRTWVVSDPVGDDANLEHLVLANDGDAPLDVSGWTVRESSLFTYTLPTPTLIPPRDHLRVFAGPGAPGTPTARDLHMGGPSQLFTNHDATAGYFHGDGAYVYDAQPGYAYGNLRAWFHYPCHGAQCTTDPLAGRLRLGTISYDPPGADTAAGEYVDVVNASAAPVALGGYGITRQGGQIPFPPNAVLPAGATLRVSMGVGVDDATRVHLGRTASLLANAGDVVTVANLNGAVLDCRAWGSMACSGLPVSGPLQLPGSPTTQAPAPAPPAVASTRPGAPQAVSVKVASRRLVVRWAAPAANGSKAVTKYRTKVHAKVGTKLKLRATCTAKAKQRMCRTGKLAKRATYVVTVQARNAKGYGPASAPVLARVR
ncbi:MAG: lamin tail domain-containing protein [Candidatus Nanopelagicales bacterium]|nr:lamin tail domain-containing protein [Candidatus Nanopelagicales bacterium]